MKLYVGNLPYSANQQTLQDTFSKCGTVESINLISDRDTARVLLLSRCRALQRRRKRFKKLMVPASTAVKSKSMKRSPKKRDPVVVGNAGKHFPHSCNDPMASFATQLRAGRF